jgi:indole-3-glycerol phosphate synthase
MNILSKIIENKRMEVAERKLLYPTRLLEKSIYFNTIPVSLKKYLLRQDKSGIIAEFKTKSPSRGDINPYADIEKVSVGYMQAGASALSILTDKTFFGGSFENLIKARKYNYCPILQKDFFVDEYQIVEAKSIGADAILLIASVLSEKEMQKMTDLAHSLGLEVLLEIHNETELVKLNDAIDVIGINNRNLNTFETNIQNSIDLYSSLPKEIVKISESGIYNIHDLLTLKSIGFDGFLIGENFMNTTNPGKACKEFIQKINKNNSDLNLKIDEYETESLRVE